MLCHRIFTRDGKVDLAPQRFLNDLPRLQEELQLERDSEQLLMIGRRHIRCNNSWMHNSQRLVKGKNRCNLMVSPQDAQRLGLVDGQTVTVSTNIGQIDLPLWVSSDIMPGVVSMPHGWGHDREGSELGIAAQKAGVSMNDITDNQVVDALTGMAIINGVPVEVRAAATDREQAFGVEAVQARVVAV
ncbi:hypothetical protein FT643_22365 [Ketobacter sp. MCCC 1A13808]|uniref:molybdopterin dinucleotide binding domain-containing protein n=1 Tax=Ketobacter sp. MCCC 1A13808 TaxID=2602738 RepID=UPI0012EBFA8F|nr:molybdopterin dinucleotide binding domain-containing protein [Ketobacter sp. MCCC 1A13808]MVF14883.1 hypothetical protein [Ketobacter sp. MCCC 1A13808]